MTTFQSFCVNVRHYSAIWTRHLEHLAPACVAVWPARVRWDTRCLVASAVSLRARSRRERGLVASAVSFRGVNLRFDMPSGEGAPRHRSKPVRPPSSCAPRVAATRGSSRASRRSISQPSRRPAPVRPAPAHMGDAGPRPPCRDPHFRQRRVLVRHAAPSRWFPPGGPRSSWSPCKAGSGPVPGPTRLHGAFEGTSSVPALSWSAASPHTRPGAHTLPRRINDWPLWKFTAQSR
jgi:hypothetical protein